MTDPGGFRYADVSGCSACGQSHEYLQFFHLAEPKIVNGMTYEWAAQCPVAHITIYAISAMGMTVPHHSAKRHDLCKYCGKSEDAHLPDCPGDAVALLKRIKWLETEVRVLIAMNEGGK